MSAKAHMALFAPALFLALSEDSRTFDLRPHSVRRRLGGSPALAVADRRSER